LSQFGVSKKLDPSSEFVIASILDLVLKFRDEGKPKFFDHGGEVIRRSYHPSANETSYDDLFEIPVRGNPVSMPSGKLIGYAPHASLRVFISRSPQDLTRFDKAIEGTHRMELHLPYAEAVFEESIESLAGVPAIFDGKDGDVGETGVFTKFKIDAQGAEAKQAAFMSIATASLGMPRQVRVPRVEVIKSNYFVYITVSEKLAIGLEVEPSDFVAGDGIVERFASRPSFIKTN